MPLETATYIHQLNPANPSGSDKVKDGDDHLRLLKSTLKATFPGITGPLDPSITPAYLLALAGGGVPFGSMVPTISETAPAGWAICNGQTVPKSDGSGNITVPDLRGKVIMGLPVSGTPGANIGASSKTVTADVGGAHTHTGTAASGGAHSHVTPGGFVGSAVTGASVSTVSSPVDPTGAGVRVSAVTFEDVPHGHTLPSQETSTSGAHTHTLSVDAAAGHGHSVTVDVTQPSMTFHIIIKI